MRVWILGSGLIGGGWALVFTAAGHQVTVIDPDTAAPARLAALFARAIPDMRNLGLTVVSDTPPPVVARADLAGPAADWVQESLPEQLALKQQALTAIEPLIAPDAIIASSSSGLSPDDMAQGLADPGRLVIAHPCNPSHLMPVVELCGGSLTPPATMDRAARMFEDMGKTVLRMAKPMPGHLVNRLQAALWREAVHLAAEGVASLGDIERAVTKGLAPRWTIIGPSTVFHVSGGDGGMARFIDALGPEFERWWDTLGQPRLDAATARTLIDGMAAADPRPVAEIAADRDARLVRIMQYLTNAAHEPMEPDQGSPR